MKTNIEELKNKYGKVYEITTTVVDEQGEDVEKTIIFKKPSAFAYDRFIKEASNKPGQAFKNLAISSVTDECKEELNKLSEEYPAVTTPFAKELLKLLGISDSTNLKVL